MSSIIIVPGEDRDPSIRIGLDSSKRRPIDNGQIDEISAFELSQYNNLNIGRAIKRTGTNPRYNCHGLTFASRRTHISEASAVQQALTEDDYHEVQTEDVLPGDIAVYYDEHGDFVHSGVVVESPSDGNLHISRIVSKWGKGPELLHYSSDSPYEHSYLKYYRIG